MTEHRSPSIAEKPTDIPKAADEPELEIKLIGIRVQPKPGAPPHWCVGCDQPINIYGRLGQQGPCHHALCWTCGVGSRTAGVCGACGTSVASMERVLAANTDVFVCYAPGCRRSYLTEYSLAEHVKLRNHVPAPRSDPFHEPRSLSKRSKRD